MGSMDSLVDGHLRHCAEDAVAAPDGQGDDRVTEATAAIARLLRS